MDMSLSKPWEMVKDGGSGVWRAAVYRVAKKSDTTEQLN